MKKYGNTEWQYMAAMARDYASKMQSNYDVDAETGKYIYAIVDEYDRNASLALKRIYENEDVESVDIYTEQGGYQTIRVKYTDGTVYNFDTNGCYDSLDDMICHEIYAYITGRIDESKSSTNMKTNNKNVVRLTESKLKQIIVESVRKVLNEATVGRGTSTMAHSTFNGTTRWKNEPYDWSHRYRKEENPYSNDTVMMLAKRLEKRLGEKYEVTAYANTYGHEKDDANNKPKTYRLKVDFKITENYGALRRYGQEDFDVEFIVKTAKQLLSNMSERVYLSNVEKHDGDDLFDDFVSSITISAILFGNIGVEPRKDMIPRRGVKEVPGEYLARGTGYADSNFK